MLKAGFSHAEEDVAARALQEERTEAARLIEAVGAAVKADGMLLSAEEKREIDMRTVALQATAGGDDHRAIKAAIVALSQATENFAARRMDKNVSAALKGRKLADVSGE